MLAVAAVCAEPRLEFDRLVYDFGKTSLVETLTGTFTYRNRGSSELRIAPPRPTCGCTVAALRPDVLPPGGRGELVFHLKVGTSPGIHNKHITIESNDPQQPILSLGLRAETLRVFQIEPPLVGLGLMRLGTTTNVTLTIRRVDGKPFRPVATQTTREFVRAQTTLVDEQTARVELQIQASGAPATVYEHVRVSADDQPVPAVASVAIAGQFVGAVRLEPEALSWAVPDRKQWPDRHTETITHRVVQVTATDPGQRFRPRNLRTSPPELRAQLITVREGEHYQIEVSVPRQLSHPLTGAVEFETDLPEAAVVRLPVQVRLLHR
jgi:hypothetical protein